MGRVKSALPTTYYPPPPCLLLKVQDVTHPVAPTAAGFVEVGLAEDNSVLILVEAVRVTGQIATVRANSVDLGNVFRYGQKAANGAEGLPPEIHVESRNDDTLAPIGQFLYMADYGRVEKLSFIQADDGDVIWNLENLTGVADRGGKQGVAVVRNDFGVSVTGVDLGLEDLDTLARDAGPF